MIDWAHGTHSIGFYITIGVGIVLALWLVMNGFFAIILTTEKGNTDGEAVVAWWTTAILWLITAAIVVGTYWPFDHTFHNWYPVKGTVAESQSRILTNGDSGVSQRYVVRLKESGELFGVDDTRASIVKPGDPISLNCKKEWQYNSEAGWGCRWGQ